MSEQVRTAIENLKRFGYPQNDPVSAQDLLNLINWITKLAEALLNEKS